MIILHFHITLLGGIWPCLSWLCIKQTAGVGDPQAREEGMRRVPKTTKPYRKT